MLLYVLSKSKCSYHCLNVKLAAEKLLRIHPRLECCCLCYSLHLVYLFV